MHTYSVAETAVENKPLGSNIASLISIYFSSCTLSLCSAWRKQTSVKKRKEYFLWGLYPR